MKRLPIAAARLPLLLTLMGVSGCLGSAERAPCSEQGPIATVCGFAQPEDLEYVASAKLILVSNMRRSGSGGTLSALAPASREPRPLWPTGGDGDFAADPGLGSDDCPGNLDPSGFSPHGLASVATEEGVRVYVVAHHSEGGGREAIEVFKLHGKGDGARLSWVACVPTPSAVQGNDLVVSSEGRIFMSNYQPDGSIRHMITGAGLKRPTGNILEWTPQNGWRHLPGTEAALANGVALSRDEAMLFYAETGTGRVYRRPLDERHPTVYVDIPGNPDNLLWTPAGKLLVPTHTGGPRFMLCLLGRLPCRSPWQLYEIDPATLAARLMIDGDGEALGAVATALQVEDRIYLGPVFDDRIGVVRLTRESP